MRFPSLILLFTALLLLEPSVPASEPAAPSAHGLEKIAPRMQEFVKDGRISGAVTLVAADGEIVHHEAVGLADVASKRPMRKETLFAIASMTKPVTATAAMILQDEGKLSVDDPVSKYLPEFGDVKLKDGGKPSKPVTIEHLLTHTSGLGGSQQVEGSLEQTAAELAKRPLSFEPGTKWQYSPGLNVCGRIVEVVSGKPYAKFLQERIFDPLKMRDTTFYPNQAQRTRIATLYQPGKEPGTIEPGAHWLVDFSGHRVANPSGGLFSTAADMARFYQAILEGGELDGTRIVSEEAVRRMTRIQTGDIVTGFTPGNGWGLGWCVVREPQGVTASLSPGTFGHGGAFGTQGWVDPQKNLVYVLMIQRTKFGNSDGSKIRKSLHDLAAGIGASE